MVSFEEAISVFTAVVAALTAYLFVRSWSSVPMIVSGVVGLLVAAAAAWISTTTFSLGDGRIAVASRFWRQVIQLDEISRVVVVPSRGLIPGRSVLIFRHEGSPVAMTSVRIGLLSWPGATAWAETVDVAIAKGQPKSQ